MLLSEITDIIESAAPLKWQEAWDNSGLQIGKGDAEIQSVLLTVDITEAVLEEALERGCNLVVSHHPLLFHGLKHITGQTPVERCVAFALLHGIAVYSTHTAMDSYLRGVSGKMAERCGLHNYRILCSSADEQREGQEHGLGVIGSLPQPVMFTDWLAEVKKAFGAPMLSYVPPIYKEVQTIALCGGAGGEFIGEAIRQKADVYVSADIRYHDMQAAVGRIGVVDMDHWVSEQFVREVLQELLEPVVNTCISKKDATPVKVM